MAIFLLIARIINEDTLRQIDRELCIYYPLHFGKDKESNIQVLIYFGRKVNTMTSAYAAKLVLKVCFINVRVQKIDNLIFKTIEIVLASFQIQNKLEKA